jgi:N-acetylmuramoyl-L-alanine amidase
VQLLLDAARSFLIDHRGMKRLLPFLVLALLAACGGPPPSVTVPPPDTVYRQLEDPLPHVDKTLLAGYKILIDPGHGGSFRGTMGADSLEEKKVNLGVALYLWGMLREAGAEVVLTRTMDRDFLTPSDSTLTSDLQARVDLADSLHPDIFISIHHNAQPARDPSMNRVETYYKAGDPASLDLAFAVHRHLMRNLGIDVGEVRQGNYYLLRKIAVPSVLGESSYLTNPGVEKKLQLSKAQELEAQAYFLGIVDYCRRGLPRVTSVAPLDSVQTSVPVIAAAFEDRGGIGIDPDGVSMLVNGEAVDAKLSADGKRAVYPLPWDAPNGLYDVRVSARNLRGNTSAVSRTRFVLDHPPAMAAIDPSPSRVPAGGGTVRVRARVMDRRGLPVADGTVVNLLSPAKPGQREAAVRDGAVDFALALPSGTRRGVHVELECRGVKFSDDIPVDTGTMKGSRSVSVRDAATGAAVTTASVLVADSALAAGSPSGNYGFVATNTQAMISAPGYRPAQVTADDTVKLTPWFGGALLGKRFVLDPQGGPPRTVGVGSLGLSASHVNLRVANYLAAFLIAAGADVRLARSTEEVPLAEDVARMTNKWRADRYIEIRHPGGPVDSAASVRSYYFPGSANGKKMAAAIGDAVAARLARAHRGPAETVTYPLQQTACPAVVIALPGISNTEEEMRLAQAWYLREQAYALFTGILAMSDVPPEGTLQVDVTAADRRDWMVTLDGTWTLQTDEQGRVVFDRVPPGSHEVRIRRAGVTRSRNIVTAAGQPAVSVSFDASH